MRSCVGSAASIANSRGLFDRNASTGLHCELVPGTLESYPLGEDGLLEICQHRFCHTENGQEDCGTFKNILEWRKEGTGYTVSRVISYDLGNFDHRSFGRMTLLRS